MEMKEALKKGGFTFIEKEESFEDVSHCGKKCFLETLFPSIHIMDCPKCNMRLTIKELAGCFIGNKNK